MGIPPVESVLEELQKVLSSSAFVAAERPSKLLRFIVEASVNGQADRLKEYTLGAEALGRGPSFDQRIDPIARVEVSRLRSRLEQYYATEGRTDSVGIVLPKGTYIPVFENRAASPVVEAPAEKDAASQVSVRQSMAWFALGGAVIACAFALFLWVPGRSTPKTVAPLMQFDIQLTGSGFVGSEVGADIALSPDGTSLVFESYSADGSPHLNVRRLDQPKVTELQGTTGARGPFFSADGHWIGFWAGGKLKKTPVGGGSPISLCDASDLLGGSWGEDGNIIATLDSTSRLWRVPSSAGAPMPILDLAREARFPRWPQVLPGAKAVLFTSIGDLGPDAGNIEVFSVRDGTRKTLVRGGTYGRYVPSGYLMYVNQGTLFAVPFDVDSLETRGGAVAVLQGVSYSFGFGFAQLDFSRAGTLVYRKVPGNGQFMIQWLDEKGNSAPLLSKPARYQWPRFSPKGERLAFSLPESGSTNIWVSEGKPNRLIPLTNGDGVHSAPAWSPDGRFIVFTGSTGMFWVRTDGASKPQPLTRSNNRQVPWSFTPDGTRLAFYEMSPTTAFDLWTVPLQVHDGELEAGNPEVFLQTPNYEVYPTYSPDGQWMAYSSNKSGAWEVYVRGVSNNSREVQISKGGGRIPHWSRNGHDLLYGTDDQRLMAVTYTIKEAAFQPGKPGSWSGRRMGDTGVFPNFDVAPDGKRVAVLLPAGVPAEQEVPNQVTFLVNFLDETHLRALAERK
jgi:Tol biopolymer transport system component